MKNSNNEYYLPGALVCSYVMTQFIIEVTRNIIHSYKHTYHGVLSHTHTHIHKHTRLRESEHTKTHIIIYREISVH